MSGASEIFNIIIGTAGHIDHGKSTLVRRLTGIDPDRLPEEKDRGMTIDLGFAPLILENGMKVGIIDVPGHERFIKNMVAGSTSVDFVLFVIAANDRVMPQTVEHLQILSMLGIRNGIVVVNKKDIVSQDALDKAIREAREFVTGTFLENAPILCVSAVTGEGVEELLKQINEKVKTLPVKETSAIFRMPVQRVFSSKGFGTVITGVPLSGTVSTGDTLEIIPLMTKVRIRHLQAYKTAVDTVRAGHSSAINISDIDHTAVKRGDTAATPGYLKPSMLVQAKFHYLNSNSRPLKSHSPVRLNIGTSEILGRLVFLNGNHAEPGTDAFVRIRLDEPVTAACGDRFIVRLQSPMITIGGGTVLTTADSRQRISKQELITILQARYDALGNAVKTSLCVLNECGFYPPTEDELCRALLRTKAELQPVLQELSVSGSVSFLRHNKILASAVKQRGKSILAEFLEKNRKKDPLSAGIQKEKLKKLMKMDAELLEVLLSELRTEGRVTVSEEGIVRITGGVYKLSARQNELYEKISRAFSENKFSPPRYDEIIRENFKDRKEGEKLISLIIQSGELIKLSEDIAMHKTAVDEARDIAIRIINSTGELSPRAMCDTLKTSRKYVIPLLEYFDKIGLTLRHENKRVLKK